MDESRDILPLSLFQSRSSLKPGASKMLWTWTLPMSMCMEETVNEDNLQPCQNDSENGTEGVCRKTCFMKIGEGDSFYSRLNQTTYHFFHTT